MVSSLLCLTIVYASISPSVFPFSPAQLKLEKLIPTTEGDALFPTYTAYDPTSRTYFATVPRGNSTASLWGMVLAGDVGSATPLTPSEVRYQFNLNALLVGLEVWNNNNALVVLAIFADGTVLQVNPTTGATSVFAKLVSDPTKSQVTSAITLNPGSNLLYAIVQPVAGLSARSIVTLGLASGVVSAATVQKLNNFNAALEQPFQMNWIPSLRTLIVFYTGPFDQLVYTDPSSGMTDFCIDNLMDYSLMFADDQFLEDGDTWSNSAYDPKRNFLYFQATYLEGSDDAMSLTTLQRLPITTKTQMQIPTTVISPMTYGYAGMQFVEVA